MSDILKALSPYSFNQLTVKNRFIRSAANSFLGNTDGTLSEADFEVYQKLMENNVGLIICGHAYVDNTYSKASDRQASFADDSIIPQYQQLVEMAKRTDTRILAQLSHTGGRSTVLTDLICPSAAELRPGKHAREMTIEEIKDVVRSFAEAACRAQKANLDGVEIHAAHLYLLSQFITPCINKRTDEYGGNVENRFRIIREIIQAIHKKCGASFPVFIKINANAPANYEDCWVAPDKNAAVQHAPAPKHDQSYFDDVCYIVKELDKLNVAGIEVSGYNFLDWKKEDHLFYLQEAVQLAKLVSTPVFPVGGITTPEDISQVFANGMEMISMCRAFVSEPDIIRKLADGGRSRCLHCNQCFVVPYKKQKLCVFH